MADYGSILKLMKQAAVEAEKAAGPVNLCFGEVIDTDPLKISVNQKMVLTNMQLILTRNVSDYEVEISVGWETNHALIGSVGANGNDLTHTHVVEGEKRVKVLNHLKKGEKVLLIRQQGGQKYIVIDRMVS